MQVEDGCSDSLGMQSISKLPYSFRPSKPKNSSKRTGNLIYDLKPNGHVKKVVKCLRFIEESALDDEFDLEENFCENPTADAPIEKTCDTIDSYDKQKSKISS